MADATERYFPELLAVDPADCGCTECLIGEYAPEPKWYANALPGDVKALMEGEIGNNSYSSLADLTVLSYYNYSETETKDYVKELYEELLSDSNLEKLSLSFG